MKLPFMKKNTTATPGELDKVAEAAPKVVAIGPEQLKKFTQILEKYKQGKSATERRIIASENWWKLRNTAEEQSVTNIAPDDAFSSKSGWLHNVIMAKHADAMESYPEANLLPREEGDRAEARKLTSIVPCVLEQNKFEETYSNEQWQKTKQGTGVYKVIWSASKLHGLGDISIDRANILNLYWEPGITHIQQSRYFFHTELWDKDLLEQKYPEQLKGGIKGNSFLSAKFLYDDHVDTENKATVIEVYYHKMVGGKNTLQYCKYVNDKVLFATENETEPIVDNTTQTVKPPMAETGLYDHCKYPYVFDPLFPIEGSPCGYGYVDICKNPQTEIDILKTSFVKNAMVGSMPRYFKRKNSSINTEQFLDLSNCLIDVEGPLDEQSLRPVEHVSLDGNYINVLDRTIQELRETSGNTEASAGIAPSGVTAASGIAALQEASGKGSRDATLGSYRAFTEVVEIVIELIRQFYDLPRQFRIMGEYGAEEFLSYSNAGIKLQHQGNDFGQDMGYRLPVFDITVSAQKKSVYTKVSQNELALQFFKMGFFSPQLTDQALMCLGIMDFDGKDAIMQKVAKNGTVYDKLMMYMQLSLTLAEKAAPEYVEQIAQDMMATGGQAGVRTGGITPKLTESDNIEGEKKQEHAVVENAREQAENASQPDAGKVIGSRK
jgi:hypothetical protein